MQLQIFVTTLVFWAGQAAGDDGGHGHDDYEHSPYHFEYKVSDSKEYLDFGQEEEDDGAGNVHGYYHVQLPDGRHQRVDYHVNGYSGYIADVKYDGEASHPSHHSSGYHGRHGKTLSFDDQQSVQKNSQYSFRSEDSDLFGSNNVREGKSFGFDELPSYSGRQGKSLDLEENLGNTGSQTDSFFSSIDRSGKSLGLESKAVDNSRRIPIPVASTFEAVQQKSENHDSDHFGSFGRQGKSLEENSFGFHSSSGHISADHGSFGSFLSSARNGKSLDLESNNFKETKTKKKKSNLISRRRIERAGILETSASKKVNTSAKAKSYATDKVKTYASQKLKPYEAEKVTIIKPQTFFEYAPKNVKSPFPSNFHEELKSRNNQDDKKHEANEQNLAGVFGIQKRNEGIAKLQKIKKETEQLIKTQKQTDDIKHIQQVVEEIESGNVNQKVDGPNPTPEKYHHEVEAEKSSVPVIRGKIIYGP